MITPDEFKKITISNDNFKVVGLNSVVQTVFNSLCAEYMPNCDFVLLCTANGLIIGSYPATNDQSFNGIRLDFNKLHTLSDNIILSQVNDSYSIIVRSSPDGIQTELGILLSRLTMYTNLLEKSFSESDSMNSFLLDSLNLVDDAICIYDKDAHLLFANDQFCKVMMIPDKNAVIGMHISDIEKTAGITIHPAKNTGSGNLKMLDVLKNGHNAYHWEVTIESQSSPNIANLMFNDMYPIISKNGEVNGMVEISHARQLNLNHTKAIMGLTADYTFDDITADSPIMKSRLEQARLFSKSAFNLLLIGESGVGKELFAQAIHNCSPSRNGPFVAVNCASFPDGLIDSELFGYVSGAFTGASKNGMVGKFELADGGTLFLDEIGELPYHFQAKLLRVLETQKVTRIGDIKSIPINVRVIAATNRNLEKMVDEGLFRQDLYYRLQVLSLEIPPLRERSEDVILLAEQFLKSTAKLNGEHAKTLDPGAKILLASYEWPGNVRELRNVMSRASLLSQSDILMAEDISSSISSKGYALAPKAPETIQERLDRRRADVDIAYTNLLKEALDIANGNKKQASELLGISRKTLYKMLGKYLNMETDSEDE